LLHLQNTLKIFKQLWR